MTMTTHNCGGHHNYVNSESCRIPEPGLIKVEVQEKDRNMDKVDMWSS